MQKIVLLIIFLKVGLVLASGLNQNSFYMIQQKNTELLNPQTGHKERFPAGSIVRVRKFRSGIYSLEVYPEGSTTPLPVTYHLWKGKVTEGAFTETMELVIRTQTEVEDMGNAPRENQNCVSENPGRCPHNRFHNQKVLYLGDSHSYLQTESTNRMGRVLSNALGDCPGNELEYRAACGNRALNWHAGRRPQNMCGISSHGRHGFTSGTSGNNLKNLSEEIETENPGEIIINLGDNMFRWSGTPRTASLPPASRTQVTNAVRTLLALIPSSTSCIWIGPTYHSYGATYRKSNEVVDLMYNTLREAINGRCDLIDSRPFFSSTSKNDGLHLTGTESIEWGNSILNEMSDL
jgi:hypothetical protein